MSFQPFISSQKLPPLTPPFFEHFHSRHICQWELPKSCLESIFTHPLNLECPSTSGTLSLVDLLWQVFSDPIMTADRLTFASPAAIGGYLFFSLLIVECSGAQFASPQPTGVTAEWTAGNWVPRLARQRQRDCRRARDRLCASVPSWGYICVLFVRICGCGSVFFFFFFFFLLFFIFLGGIQSECVCTEGYTTGVLLLLPLLLFF